MSKIVYEKFQDLSKKANFWFEITKSLPCVCPVDCWKVCFEKSFAAQEKLWNFQQENRKILEKEHSFNREQIGDIAWNIASIYLHYYIRTISKDYLKRSILFFEAIVERGYFDEIKSTEKHRNFLLCFSIACLIANKFKRSRSLMYQITEADHPADSSQSFIFSQPSFLLNDIENILQISHGGEIFERGPIGSFFTPDSHGNGHSISSFLSISTSSNPLYGELTFSNVIISGLISHFKTGITQFFVRDSDSMSVFNSIFHAIKTSCVSSTNVLLLHIDAQVRKTLVGEDVFYFDNSTDPRISEEDNILSFTELGLVKRKLIIISESIISLSGSSLSESIFIVIPIKSTFWKHNPILLLYSTEFLFYELYTKSGLNEDKKGKIGNIIRVHTQMYHKFMTEIVTSAFKADSAKYKWVMDCPMGRMMLLNYLMAYFFLSWIEFKLKNIHLNCPIRNILPYEIFLAQASIYKFLESLTGPFSSTAVPLRNTPEIVVPTIVERLKLVERDSMSNMSPSIISKLDRRLFMNSGHPVGIVKELIWNYFKQFKDVSEEGFKCFDHFDPIVSVEQNFDFLCFPSNHVGRSSSDSYFINNKTLLRTHMTANEPEYIKSGHRAFLVAGDVYRRDEIDSTHYPVFHQLEGVRIFEDETFPKSFNTDSPFNRHFALQYDYETQYRQDKNALRFVTDDLYFKLTGLMRHLFGESTPIRWQTCFFPFTSPSFEIEIQYRDKWVEVCGCGVLQQSILKDCNAPSNGWAFGLGLERLAMILFDIPDIRMFWSQDERFLNQFQSGKISKFVPFSKYPPSTRDISFWINENEGSRNTIEFDHFDSNSLFDLIRQKAGDLVEDVKSIDTFKNEIGKVSKCYRIVYRAIDRTLTDEEVNEIQEEIRKEFSKKFNISLR